MTDLEPTVGELSPTVAWSRRVRRVGGFIQLAFAALWLVRGGLNVHQPAGIALAGAFSVMVLAVLAYGIRVTAGTGARPSGQEAKRIERSVTIATIIELVAAFVLPVIVIAAGHSDWVLPVHRHHDRTTAALARPPGPHPPVSPGGLGVDRRSLDPRCHDVGYRPRRHHGYRRWRAALGDRRRRFPRPRRPACFRPVEARPAPPAGTVTVDKAEAP